MPDNSKKVSLLFLLIDDPGKGLTEKLAGKEFTFSHNYRFCVDYQIDSLTITCSKEENIFSLQNLPNFPKNLLEITGIVGENGAGKTSLLYFLYRNTSQEEDVVNHPNFVAVYSVLSESNSKFVVVQNMPKRVFFKDPSKTINEISPNNVSALPVSTTIYFTNSGFTTFPFLDLTESPDTQIDISMVPENFKKLREKITSKSPILAKPTTNLELLYSRLIHQQYESSIDNLVHLLFLYYINKRRDPITREIKYLKDYPDLTINVDNDLYVSEDIVGGPNIKRTQFKSLYQLLRKDLELEAQLFKNNQEEKKFSTEITKFATRFGKYYDPDGSENCREFKLSYRNAKSQKEREDYLFFLDWINKNTQESSEKSFIFPKIHIYTESLSDGEHALLNLFSYIFFQINIMSNNDYGNILLLVDEVDLYFHPEWQKNIINYLFMLAEFSSYSIQIIFTTHSPICVSDIPKANLISFGFNGEINAFPSNFSSFANSADDNLSSLFLKNNPYSLGTVSNEYLASVTSGLFRKDNPYLLINEISLTDYEEKKKEINQIGNTMIRNMLLYALEKIKHGSN